MTPQQKVDAINASGEIDRCESLAKAAVRSHRPVAQRILILREVTDTLNRVIAPYTPCRDRCSHCCKQAVAITQAEADVISSYTGRPNVPQPELTTFEQAIALVEDDRRNYTGKACPFLVDDRCSIYAARPLNCRMHHSLADTPENCDTAHPERSVPWYNTNPYAAAVAEITGHMGDIRKYFP